MIISASRRTDVPAFYSQWFLNRLAQGFFMVRNPMNPQLVSKVSIKPNLIDCIVFWTKNPRDMMKKMDHLEGYNYYFLFTNSLYSAKYKPLDGNWYNSRYNNSHITNILGGKEFIVREKNVLGVNGRFIWSGGRRYTPVDPDQVDIEIWDIYDEKQ